MNSSVLCSLFVGFLLNTASAERYFAEKRPDFERIEKEFDDRAWKGDLEKAINHVLETARRINTAEANCRLGQLLIGIDDQTALVLLEKAHKVAPNTFAYPFAMQLHRLGKRRAAIPLYRRAKIADDAIGPLLADCLLRTNDFSGAVSAWMDGRRSDADSQRVVAFRINSIYKRRYRVQRHADLLKALHANTQDAAERLVLEALYPAVWEENRIVDPLPEDLRQIEKYLANDPCRLSAIKCLIQIHKSKDPRSDINASTHQVRQKLKDSELILDGGKLPECSLLAKPFVNISLENRIVSKRELFTRFSDELWKRATSRRGDSESLAILCELAAAVSNERLDKYFRYGWDRYGKPEFAIGLLKRMDELVELKANSPELLRALKQFPENNSIQHVRLLQLNAQDTTIPVLVDTLKAEYRNVAYDTRRLDTLFRLIKRELEANAKEQE